MLNISGTRAMHGTLLSELHVAEYYSISIATFFGIHFMLCMPPI